jgi:hypothetical protein
LRLGAYTVTAAVALVAGLAIASPGEAVGNAAASAGTPVNTSSLTTILSPSNGALVSGGQVAVKLRSGAPLSALRVLLNGQNVTGRFHANRAAGYEAVLRLGSLLNQGSNLLTVSTNSRGRSDFDYASFVVARPQVGLVHLRPLLGGVRGAPITVAINRARNATLLAWLNGRPVRGSFVDSGGQEVGVLGANDGVRHGRNQLRIVAYTSGNRAGESSITRRFDLPKSDPIAGAGSDQIVAQDQPVRLNGARSVVALGATRRSYRWQIIARPPGSRAKLRAPTTANPGLTPDRPGTYRIRLTFASRVGRAAPVTSNDTVLVEEQPGPQYGVPLFSLAATGEIIRNGALMPGTRRTGTGSYGISYTVLNRTTLARRTSGEITYQQTFGSGLTDLADIARSYSDGNSLMVVNWKAPLAQKRAELAALFKAIGGGEFPADDPLDNANLPGTMIGIPGAAPGVAFLVHRVSQLPNSGDVSGYLRLNSSRVFDFVFTDSVPVDTASSEAATSTTITVGGHSYAGQHASGVSGFHLLRLDPQTLDVLAEFTYATNAADGAPQASEQTRLANDLAFSASQRDQPERPLVILQSYGEPKGTSSEWDRAAIAIEQLGGTRQVFDDLNQPSLPGSLQDNEEGRKGGYAFIGRAGSTAPRAEVSYPLDGLPARLQGLLMRSRTADYEPMIVAPPAGQGQADTGPPIDEALVRIVNELPTDSFPPLALDANPEFGQAAQNFLGGPDVMKVCNANPCDVRATYYQKYGTLGQWQEIKNALQGANCGGHSEFPAVVCDQVKSQLLKEVLAANQVRAYLEALQKPFGTASVAALANLGDISDGIQQSLQPKPEAGTTSKLLTIVSYAVKIGGFAGPQANAMASGVGSALALGAYATTPSSEPDLIGPAVRTAASQLGVELTNRYLNASDQLTELGKIILSDYDKLTQVARIAAPLDPGAIQSSLIRAAKQSIAETLIPVAWPILYDLGLPPKRTAEDWNCYYKSYLGLKTEHLYLFRDEPSSGQVLERFPNTNWEPVMAIGGYTSGRNQNAIVSTPSAERPKAFMDDLFKGPLVNGLGLKKLEFFSPRLFRLFPSSPARGLSMSQSLGGYDTVSDPYRCHDISNPPGSPF